MLTVQSSAPKLAGGVYWQGTDGNTYYKVNGATKNLGANADTPSLVLNGANQIKDPNPGGNVAAGTTATGQVSSNSGSGTALNTAAISASQQAIDSLGTEQRVGNQNIDSNLNSVTGKYNQDAAKNEGNYNEQTVTNNQNLQKNKQNALLAAAQGRRGLRGTLSSIGALSGDGITLSDRAVTDSANDDLGEAADTATTNQTTLDKAIGDFRDDDKERRAEAQTSAANSRTALEGTIAQKRQQYLQKQAELYGAAGKTGDASRLLSEAGGLNNEIASKTAVAAAPITERSAAYTPGDIENYLAGAGDMTVGVADGGAAGAVGTGANTLLAGRKKKEAAMAA